MHPLYERKVIFMKNTTLLRAVAVIVLFALMTALAACDTNKIQGNNFLESIPDIPSANESSEVSDASADPEPKPGQAHMPVIATTGNITAGHILVTGTCDEGATVKISGGKHEVTVKSLNGYFMAEVEMISTTVSVLEAVAYSDTLTESEVRSFDVTYDATAEKRVDGNGVTVGANSYLLFDSVMDDYLGKNLISQTELKAFKEFVNNKAANLKKKGGSYPATLVYVLIPDSVAIYPERLPENTDKTAYRNRYQYISEALSETNATLIDMTDVFLAHKDEQLIYQNTDSHLTEYGAYLVYQEICKVMETSFPDAKARDLNSEFTATTSEVLGGDLAYYAGIDREVITETVTRYTPKFSLRTGKWENSELNISDVKKYAEDGDARLVSGTNEAAARIIFKTGRDKLPCALIYRDANSLPMFDALAERFNNVMFGKVGDFTVNMTDAQRYSSSGKTSVDYIFVMVSENNIESILK